MKEKFCGKKNGILQRNYAEFRFEVYLSKLFGIPHTLIHDHLEKSPYLIKVRQRDGSLPQMDQIITVAMVYITIFYGENVDGLQVDCLHFTNNGLRGIFWQTMEKHLY